MAEYINIAQLWQCETCYHHGEYGCTLGAFGCDHGESYRPAYGKLKKADVAPVVRCKDCIHYETCESGKDFCCFHAIGIVPDDFCSYGERKDGDG